MNKEELQQRIVLINIELGQIRNNGIKLEGHLAETQHWLDALIKKEEESQNPPME